MGRRCSSALVGYSSRRWKLLLLTYGKRNLLTLSELARPWQLNLLLFSELASPILVFEMWCSCLSKLVFYHISENYGSGYDLGIAIGLFTLGVEKGMLLVKHLAPKILMAVNYCGRQLARTLGWAAPAYHDKQA